MSEIIAVMPISSPSTLSPRSQSKLSQHFQSTRGYDDNMTIVWENIDYSLLVKDQKTSKPFAAKFKEKNILRNISGSVQSGMLYCHYLL